MNWTIIYAETGKDFQEYVDEQGKPIKAGQPIGIEKRIFHHQEIRLLSNIYITRIKTR